MIKKHNSLVRAEKILNSFKNSTYQNDTLDGVIEAFKQSNRQGYVLKIYKNYEPDSDICLWVYEDRKAKKIYVIQGTHNNCDELNNYCGYNLSYKEYPIVSDIKRKIVDDMIKDVYSFYDKEFKI
jgi:hypothetical protein